MPYRHTHTQSKMLFLKRKGSLHVPQFAEFYTKEISGKEGQILHGITPVDSKNHLLDRNGRAVAARVQ